MWDLCVFVPLRWILQRWRVRSLWCSIDTVGQVSWARGGRGNAWYHTTAHHCRNGVASGRCWGLGNWSGDGLWKEKSTKLVESEWIATYKNTNKCVSPLEKQEQVHNRRYDGTYWSRWLEWTFPVLVLEATILMLVGCPWIQGLDDWVGWYYWKKRER